MPRIPPGRVRAPELPDGLAWFNTPAPLRLADLRGSFVVLDFWTYGCINCLHVLRDLHRLQDRYGDALTVIGVHAGKFTNERDAGRLQRALERLDVDHPVVNDPHFAVWDRYAVRAWPTTFLVDPGGVIVGQHVGEGVFAPFDALLRPHLGAAERRDDEAAAPPSPTALRFPGGLAVDPARERLFIADTGHHRLVAAAYDGAVEAVVGSGTAGLADGGFGAAAFRRPHGLAYDADADRLYVADTGNHALRCVDLEAGRVTTVLGTGRQPPWGQHRAAPPDGGVNAPWDVLLHGGRLYAALAGAHQVWTVDPATGRGAVYAGTGEENLVDGRRLEALLAQPSALATDGAMLYVADAEASALRRVPLGGDARALVETLVGTGLFAFGDAVGPAATAQLQHPLGLAVVDGALVAADTYNHRLVRLDPATGRLDVVDGPPGLEEPGALAADGRRLFAADTNRHRVWTGPVDGTDWRVLALR